MEEVAHLLVLGVHVGLILLIAGHLDGVAAQHLDAVVVQTENLHRIVGHQYQFPDAEVGEDGAADIVVAKVCLEA